MIQSKVMYRFISDDLFPDCILDGLHVAYVPLDDFIMFSVCYCNPSSLLSLDCCVLVYHSYPA